MARPTSLWWVACIVGVAVMGGRAASLEACTVCVAVRGGFDVAHARSLDIAMAIRREIDAGRLSTPLSLAPPDVLGRNLVRQLDLRDGFELLLIEDRTRYRFDGRADVRGRQCVPTRLWITGRAVLRALAAGLLDLHSATSRGLLVVEAVEQSSACLANVPLHLRIAAQETIALGRPVQRLAEGRARFRIREVLRGKVSVKEVTLTPDFLLPGADYVLLGDGSALRLRPEAIAFVRELLKKDAPSEALLRLQYFLPFVDASDPQVAAAVRYEFAAAPYSALKSLAPSLEPGELVRGVERGMAPNESLLTLLIGIAGDPAALPVLERWLVAPSWQKRAEGYDALIAAYLLLRGPEGLERVATIVAGLDEPHRRVATRAFHAALWFHEHEEHLLLPARIRLVRTTAPRLGANR